MCDNQQSCLFIVSATAKTYTAKTYKVEEWQRRQKYIYLGEGLQGSRGSFIEKGVSVYFLLKAESMTRILVQVVWE